jgi:hypothetical protein
MKWLREQPVHMCTIDNTMGQSVSIYNFANTKALAQATLHIPNNKM